MKEFGRDVGGFCSPNLVKPPQIWLKGPGVAIEYFNNEKATRESFVDGWYKVGTFRVRDHCLRVAVDELDLLTDGRRGQSQRRRVPFPSGSLQGHDHRGY